MKVVRVGVVAVFLLAVPRASTECGLVRPLGREGGAAAIVRGRTYTKSKPSGCAYEGAACSRVHMDPLCGSGAEACAELAAASCSPRDGLDVVFNSRSYLLDTYAGQCESSTINSTFDCVDYTAGAYHLAGQTLSFELDLSEAGCGCNAAVYLVAMPRMGLNPTTCGDHYCDANSVCGATCAEIDLVEANKAAFVSTVHVADDPNGEGFGLGHYVKSGSEKALLPEEGTCAYGPRQMCTIDTNQPFVARFRFSDVGEPFGIEVSLHQTRDDGVARTARMGVPVRYLDKPGKGAVGSADAANAVLREQLDSGLTLVVSYWAGAKKKEMAWLDSPCTPAESAEWGCSDVWMEDANRGWPWTCNRQDAEQPPGCARAWRISKLSVTRNDSLFGVPRVFVVGFVLCALAAIMLLRLAVQRGVGPFGRKRGGAKLVPAVDYDDEEAASPTAPTPTKPRPRAAAAAKPAAKPAPSSPVLSPTKPKPGVASFGQGTKGSKAKPKPAAQKGRR